MDEVALCWLGWFFIIAWRTISVREGIARKLHFTWYHIFFGIYGLLLVWSLKDIILFEYNPRIENFLDPVLINNTLESIKRTATNPPDEQEISELKLSTWLRVFSLVSPIAGLCAFIIVAWNVIRLHVIHSQAQVVVLNKKVRLLRDNVLFTVGLPAVFTVMAIRATIRMWAIMTGSCWRQHEKLCGCDDWQVVRGLELGTYQAALGTADAFQFYAVFIFARLCSHYLRHSKHWVKSNDSEDVAAAKTFKKRVSHAALQGVYAYVIVGLFRTMVHLVAAVATNSHSEYRVDAARWQQLILDRTGAINSFVTVAGVVNMFIIGTLADITAHIGDANMKFNGARALLLISQIQPQLLSAFTINSTLYKEIEKNHDQHLHFMEKIFRMSRSQAELFHVSLLNFECLAVAIFNLMQWRRPVYERMVQAAMDYEKDLALRTWAPGASKNPLLRKPTLMKKASAFLYSFAEVNDDDDDDDKGYEVLAAGGSDSQRPPAKPSV